MLYALKHAIKTPILSITLGVIVIAIIIQSTLGIYFLTEYLPSEQNKKQIAELAERVKRFGQNLSSEQDFIDHVEILQKNNIRVGDYSLKISLTKESLCEDDGGFNNVVLALDNEKCFFFQYNKNIGATFLFSKDSPVNVTIWLPLISLLFILALILIYIFVIYRSYFYSIFYASYLYRYSNNFENKQLLQLNGSHNKFLSYLNRKVISSTTNIESIIKSRSKLLSSTLHDIQGPLNRVRLRMEIEKGEVSIKDEKDFNEIKQICSALILYGKTDWLTTENNQSFNLISLLMEVEKDYLSVDCNITFHFIGKRIQIYGKQNALKRAFNNLIDNAFSHGDTVQLNLMTVQNKALLTIIDNGPGIDTKLKDVIFQYGVSMKGSSGLGLAIVKEIIDYHKGDIKILNIEKGLKIEITLPI
ncbi:MULTISPECIES: sensor histidine kinase [Cysteiniphilum]|uniref:histidine kinase n=1 Tax=Cysteiniphilum litorale TaxID=2056700 RepID=A0A8J2Z2F0_9GAMM|nr:MULTISPECIES: HAMP domain-containing sensor histidine kinase [Cysteiniphilum]GGF88853.1 hypothetical protein GCM10010995_02620 [Cysteiniphilum litorale]